MTVQERAERAVVKLAFPEDGRVCWSYEEEIAIIAAEIQAAIDEATKCCFESASPCNNKKGELDAAYRRGVEDERKACAGICLDAWEGDEFYSVNGNVATNAMLDRIRARSTEGGGR